MSRSPLQRLGFSLALILLLAAFVVSPALPAAASVTPAAAAAADAVPDPVIDWASARQIDLVGDWADTLPNGNLVVTSYAATVNNIGGAGMVTLYDGATGAVISRLTGSHWGDKVGAGGIEVLADGNFVVRSDYWSGQGYQAGAVTWCSAVTGCDGEVSAANSLVGSTENDLVGMDGVVPLDDGSYVVASSIWDRPGMVAAGAVTWCPANSGCVGEVSPANSLVGSSAFDRVGYRKMINTLSNGSYVVTSPNWALPAQGSSSAVPQVGAVTWCSGQGGCVGEVSPANSLVGSHPQDSVGSYAGDWAWSASITPLSDGDYVVTSFNWDGAQADVGAVTWCSGQGGCLGEVSPANSLVGNRTGNTPGSPVELENGVFVVSNSGWDLGPADAPIEDAGAVTWCSGQAPCAGEISAAVSLLGSSAGDQVGGWADEDDIVALSGGSYTVKSPYWDRAGMVDAGAVTFCPASGCVGVISTANSLLGASAGDKVGEKGVTRLMNGAYLVSSPAWDAKSLPDVGAVTWCPASGCMGEISSTNSLVGSSAYDQVGLGGAPLAGSIYTPAQSYRGMIELSSGDYIVSSPYWKRGGLSAAGAVTYCPASGCFGAVSEHNSLVGGAANQRIGSGGFLPLSSGAYVVNSPFWNTEAVPDVGAVTWCPALAGCQNQVVTAANSLTGQTNGDQVGSSELKWLANDSYVVRTPLFDDGATSDAGAVTWCSGSAGCIGAVSPSNSLVGSSTDQQIGKDGLTPLPNGSYVVRTNNASFGAVTNAGAVTWCSGTKGCVGYISPENSLVGSTSDDLVGNRSDYDVYVLPNSNYVVISPMWDAPGKTDAGAVTYGAGWGGTVGPISAANSIITDNANTYMMDYQYDEVNERLIVSRYAEHIVSLLKLPHTSRASGGWQTSSTWDYGAPLPVSNVVVAAGHRVTFDTTTEVHDVTIQGELAAANEALLTVTGDWLNPGSFDAGAGQVIFNAAGAAGSAVIQTISGDTVFHDLGVQNGVTLTTSSNVTFTGTLGNLGWISETKAVSGPGLLSYGLGGVRIQVTEPGSLAQITVKRRDQDHPHANLPTARYWNLSANPQADGFRVTLSLPGLWPQKPSAAACRYADPAWDCAGGRSADGFITREGVTAFSDWAAMERYTTFLSSIMNR